MVRCISPAQSLECLTFCLHCGYLHDATCTTEGYIVSDMNKHGINIDYSQSCNTCQFISSSSSLPIFKDMTDVALHMASATHSAPR